MNIDLEQAIRERAYGIWEREGRLHGRHEEHWHAAKLELAAAQREGAPIAVPAARGAEPAKRTRRAAPAKPEATVAPAATPRRRSPARPAP